MTALMSDQATGKVLICHHPMQLLLYCRLACMIHRCPQPAALILVMILKPHHRNTDFAYLKDNFDLVFEFPFIEYRKNVISGLLEGRRFKNDVRERLFKHLDCYDNVDVFLTDSGSLPVNLLLAMLAGWKRIRSLVRFLGETLYSAEIKSRALKNFICDIYSFFLRCYRVQSMFAMGSKMVGYRYRLPPPGRPVKPVSPAEIEYRRKESADAEVLPVPVVSGASHRDRDMVLIFGSDVVWKEYQPYFPDYAVYCERLTVLWKGIERAYAGHKICYKPHPLDRNRLMPGIDRKVFEILNEEEDGNFLIDHYAPRTRAVYSFYSTCSYVATMYGIPGYWFYKYLFTEIPGFLKQIQFYVVSKDRNPLLKHVSAPVDIGSIDTVGFTPVSEENLSQAWQGIINGISDK